MPRPQRTPWRRTPASVPQTDLVPVAIHAPTPAARQKLTRLQLALQAARQLAQQGGAAQPPDPDRERVLRMLYAFEEALGTYLHRPSLRYLKGQLDASHGAYRPLLRACQLADQHGVSYPTYLQAQFWHFDKWFNRPPRVYELAAERTKFPAARRLREYLAMAQAGKIKGSVVSIVQRSTRMTDAEVDKINQQRWQQAAQAWGLSRADVLIRFGSVQAALFDQAWLRRQPLYQQLRREGKIK